MKIGILTQPLCDNFGGILQAYALHSVLEQYGHQVILINRIYQPITIRGYLLRCFSVVKCILLKYICRRSDLQIADPFYYVYNIHKHAASNFIRGHINCSKPLGNDELLRAYVAKECFDAIIVGSDQVWRSEYSPSIKNYFLDFLSQDSHVKRVAYAASFGTHNNPIEKEYLVDCIKLAHSFDAISVREQSSVGYMQKVFELTPVCVLDPTLLLTADYYRALYKIKRHQGEKYIACYILDRGEEKEKIQKAVAEELGFPIHYMSANGKEMARYNVEEWLQMIDSAEFVVTDSFHGCVFSIIFQKPFICIGNKERGMERFYSLLSQLSLEKRFVSFSHPIFPSSTIDWTRFNERLEYLRKNSRQFLAQSLG